MNCEPGEYGLGRILSMVISLLIILSIASPMLQALSVSGEEIGYWTAKIHPIFLKKILSLNDDDVVTAVIRLKSLPKDIALKVKGNYRLAIDTLKWWAEYTQEPVIRFITSNGGLVLNRFWLDNIILVRVRIDLLKKIAMLPDVIRIFENFEVRIPEPILKSKVSADQEVSSWGIFKIRAPEAWGLGYLGEGVRICVVDTGVDITHPALAGKMLTLDPTSPYYPGGWMEFDEYGNPVLSEPHDTDGHGTHTSGTALGGDTENILIGVAPGATLMHALALPYGGGTFAQVLAGMQWAVEPFYIDPNTGELIPTGLPAHVVSMSFGADNYYGNELLPVIEAMLLANIIPVAAAGNCGPGCTDNPGNIWGAFAIGATDINDEVASWSSGGVVDWPDEPEEWPFFDIYPDIYIKPDFSAPGVGITSSIPGGGYEAWDGTSMATPHVSGTVALILQAAGWTDFSMPDTPEKVYLILNSTAVDFGDPGQDTRYGWGRIDAYEAVRLAEQFAKTTGVEGFVFDAETSEPIPWATVTVNETGKTVTVNGSGYFKIPLDPGNYTLVFEAFGYETQTLSVEVIVVNGTIAGFVFDEVSGQPIAGASVTVEELNLTVYTNSTGGFRVSVPPGTYNVTATATGYEPESEVVQVGEAEVVIVTFELTPLGYGAIIGWVTDAETGLPIENATVWVEVDSTSIVNYTDVNGYYELHVPSGVYTVHALAPGYGIVEVPGVSVPPNEVVTVNITLAPIPPTVVVLSNVDYYTEPHLADIIATTGLPVVEYDSIETLLEDWVNGEVYPKVVVLDHTEPSDYSYPSNDTLVAFLLLADAYGTSLIWLGTSYSGYTSLDVLYMYEDSVESLGYPAPDDYEYGYPSPEYVLVYMLWPDHPVFNGVVPDEDNWFYLANITYSDWADYKAYYFEDDPGFVELAYINDTYGDVYDGVGVGLWNSSTGVPWFYLGSWAESWWMQYLEPGSDGMYSNNTMTVLLNAVSLGYGASPTGVLSLEKARLLANLITGNEMFHSTGFKERLYTYVEVYLERKPYGWITGQVVGSDGAILAGAKVAVLGTPITVETDENGEFLFWLPEGNYTLVISCPGYYPELTNVTVIANETIDLDTIVLQRRPRVAIMHDYAGVLKSFVESLGFYAKDYTNLTELNYDLLTGFYDLVIYAGHYEVPFPTRTEFMDFVNITTELGIGVIWLDSYGDYGYGIKVLNYYLGDPGYVGYDFAEGYVYITVQESHPILRGYEPGDTVMIISWTGADFAWFSDFSGETLATLIIGGFEYGDSIAYKILPTGAKWILMASFAPTEWNTPDVFTEDAWTILANAILWGITKPINVWFENPYLHVGDEAVLHISKAPANTTLNVYLDGSFLASTQTDDHGNATLSFIVPLIPGGEHLIDVTTEDTLYYGTTKLYILPKIDVYPAETTSPGQVRVIATGLYSGQSIYIYIDANYLSLITTNSSGAYEGVINLPVVVSGTHTISLVDTSGETLYRLDILVHSIFDDLSSNLTFNVIKIDELLDRLNNVSESLIGLDSNVENILVDLQAVSGRLESIEDLLNNIVGTLETVSSDTAYIKTGIGTITAKIDELNATLVGVIVTETGNVYALLNTSVGTITAKLDDLEDLGLTLSNNMATALEDLGVLDTKIDTLSSKIDTEIEELQNYVSSIYDNLSTVINNIKNDLSNEHSQILGKLNEITSSIQTLSTTVDNIVNEELPSVEQKVEYAKSTASTASNIGFAGLGLAIVALAAAIFSIARKK
ncbi:MAG: hypothetical protein DRO40_01840 [Thermoprotei archaeon]|nr:MAG: hypothetical protein DRO40_01840 [Thermoprotei archaeon]